MKCFFITLISFLTSTGFAVEADQLTTNGIADSTRWRFGVGLGVQSQMQDVVEIEVGTGELFHCGSSGMSLILSYKGGNTELEDVNNEHYVNHSYKLMLESKSQGTNPFARTYVRLGVGLTDSDKRFVSDGQFIMMPFQLGMDTKIMQTDTSYLAFYVQAGSEVNFLNDDVAAKDFDGVAITLGFRGYY